MEAGTSPAVSPSGGTSDDIRHAQRLLERREVTEFRALVRRSIEELKSVPAVLSSKLGKLQGTGEVFAAFIHESVGDLSRLYKLGAALGVAPSRVAALPLHRELIRGLSAGIETGDNVFAPTMRWVYHSLHGAASVFEGHCRNGIALSNHEIPDLHAVVLIRTDHATTGWAPQCADYIQAWKILRSLGTRHAWIREYFGSTSVFETCLTSYFLHLNIQELAVLVSHHGQEAIVKEFSQPNVRANLDVPIACALFQDDVRAAVPMLLDDPDGTRYAWTRVGVSTAAMRACWPHWVAACQRWLASHSRGFFTTDPELPDADFFSRLAAC
jgi:hypothetical protein